MNEILKMLNALSADELDSVIMRASIILEKKRKEEAEAAQREKERKRQELIEQEKRRRAEIEELQRKLRELENQKVDIPEEPGVTVGKDFVMYDPPKPVDQARAAAEKPAFASNPTKISCPHCHTMNVADSLFCENCGKQMSAPKTEPKPQPASKPSGVSCPHCHHLNTPGSLFCESCGKKMIGGQPAQASHAQVRYADESMKKWEKRPGEITVRGNHEILMLQPNGGKYAYYMEVTNQRILLTRESSAAKNVGLAARMGAGLVGSLIAEGVKASSGSGPKPWLEIPLAAVLSCGVQNKKDFFIVADQTYVFQNKSYEKFLPDMVAKAKNGGI